MFLLILSIAFYIILFLFKVHLDEKIIAWPLHDCQNRKHIRLLQAHHNN